MELSLEEIIKMKKIGKSNRNIPTKRFYNKANTKTAGEGGRSYKLPRQNLQGGRNMNAGGKPLDARMKIIQKNRQRLTDARDKLVEIAKHTDARNRIKRQKMNYQNGRQKLNGKTNFYHNQRNSNKAPVVLQRSIKNNGSANLRDPSSIIRCTINRPETDFNYGYGENMNIDEPISVPRVNNYSGIQVAFKNEYTPFACQDYIHSQHSSYMGSYDVPTTREVEPRMSFQRRSELPPRRMSLEMRARLDTPPRPQRPPSPIPHKQPLGYRIVVSNLHSSVTHEDIKELFEDIGPLLASRLVRAGTAEVVYKYQKDAKKAVEAYHNRQLDGQPMKCLLVNSQASSSLSSNATGMRSNSLPTASKFPGSSKSTVIPDLSAIHKALFTHK